MMLDSIVAVVDHGNGNGYQLPLRETKPGSAAHQVFVERQVVLQRFGVQAGDRENAVHEPIRTPMPAVEFPEPAFPGLGFAGRNRADPGHSG